MDSQAIQIIINVAVIVIGIVISIVGTLLLRILNRVDNTLDHHGIRIDALEKELARFKEREEAGAQVLDTRHIAVQKQLETVIERLTYSERAMADFLRDHSAALKLMSRLFEQGILQSIARHISDEQSPE